VAETLVDMQLSTLCPIWLLQQALGFQTIQVGHQEAEVFIVEQAVQSDEGIPSSWQFYLLSDG
jgi:hypothetical protein